MPIPPRVSVVALRTADLARSTAFYVALGWELSPASTAAMSLFKTAGSLLLVSTDELLASSLPQDPRVRGQPLSFDGMTLWPLTNRGPVGGIQPFKMRLSTKRRIPPEVLPVHEGHDWLYVLDGRLRLLLGAEDLTIEPGEAVEFTTWTPHWFGAIDGPVELIGLFGAQGERMHLHG